MKTLNFLSVFLNAIIAIDLAAITQIPDSNIFCANAALKCLLFYRTPVISDAIGKAFRKIMLSSSWNLSFIRKNGL